MTTITTKWAQNIAVVRKQQLNINIYIVAQACHLTALMSAGNEQKYNYTDLIVWLQIMFKTI